MTITHSDYWLRHFKSALENAEGAPGEGSRTAYLDLASHYWAMHMGVNGRPDGAPTLGKDGQTAENSLKQAA